MTEVVLEQSFDITDEEDSFNAGYVWNNKRKTNPHLKKSK
ncbi:hypothetical protein HNP81_001735 [Peribacillus huizhouensis]|uniref:Uncharacterized protein n=1 Tax=Peribacillus huizhouensis TaxID=1501239 RepID=A0ABR6CN87_9BACI|nr:hypothetical protein [Peribacillus huizhouensis]